MDSSRLSLSRLRRRYSADFKRRLVEQSLQPGASVAAIALAHQLNANLLHKWRREHRREQAPAAALVAVDVRPAPDSALAPTAAEAGACEGQIEIGCGRLHVRISGRVDAQALRSVLALLERA